MRSEQGFQAVQQRVTIGVLCSVPLAKEVRNRHGPLLDDLDLKIVRITIGLLQEAVDIRIATHDPQRLRHLREGRRTPRPSRRRARTTPSLEEGACLSSNCSTSVSASASTGALQGADSRRPRWAVGLGGLADSSYHRMGRGVEGSEEMAAGNEVRLARLHAEIAGKGAQREPDPPDRRERCRTSWREHSQVPLGSRQEPIGSGANRGMPAAADNPAAIVEVEARCAVGEDDKGRDPFGITNIREEAPDLRLGRRRSKPQLGGTNRERLLPERSEPVCRIRIGSPTEAQWATPSRLSFGPRSIQAMVAA
jgi:hypothetical protein